jgi:hypothetical protein
MARLTFELDDETFEDLFAMAEQLGVSVEEFVAAAIAREIDGIGREFFADVDDMIDTYRPVLHRLAQ